LFECWQKRLFDERILTVEFFGGGKEENKCITTEWVATLAEKPARILLKISNG